MKRKVLSALLSIGIAFGLWLYVVTVVSPGSEKEYYNIPVVLEGETVLLERGLMITSGENPTVSLKLAGTRTDLNKLNSSNITVIARLSSIYDPGKMELTYSVSYPGDIPEGAISIQSKNPENITLEVEQRLSKEVPVEIEYAGKVPEDYLADKENRVLDYEQISITGPKSAVDKIAKARIDVDLEGKSETISDQFTYTLCDEAGVPVDAELVTTNVEAVSLTLKINRVQTVRLNVDILEGGGANLQTAEVKVEPETIMVSGSETLLQGLQTLNIGTVDLGSLAEDTEMKFPIKLPEGVTNETGVTEVTVQVRFPTLRTKTLNVTNITATNVPAGMRVELITKALEITVRGPKAKIDTIKETDIAVTVDFSGAQPGTETKQAVITPSPNFAEVGAVGSYSVSATVRD